MCQRYAIGPIGLIGPEAPSSVEAYADGIEEQRGQRQPSAVSDRGERSRWPPVTRSRTIAAHAADVWTAISTRGNLEFAHPFCASNPVEVWPGTGARDAVHYLSGWIYERECVDWVDGVGYDLLVGGAGERPSEVSWRIGPPAGDAGIEPTDLSITIRPRSIDRVPAIAQRAVQRVYVRRQLARYLDSVLRGFDWWITTGEPVQHDQFGRHPWFSEPVR